MIRAIKALCRSMIKSELATIRTSIPGQVVSYDEATNSAKIQLCVRAVRTEDPNNIATVNLPVLEDVPVKQFGSGKLVVTVAPKVGSYGTVFFSDREIETWLTNGGIVDPFYSRRFDLSDAIFDPGLYPFVVDGDNGKIVAPIEVDRISIRTRSGNTQISVLEDESILLKSTGKVTTSANETVIQDGTDWAVQYTALKSAFDTLKNDFNTFLNTQYNLHMHPTAAPGAPSITTLIATPTSADMTGAKVAKVRLP